MFRKIKKARTDSILVPLATVIEGTVSDGRLRGRYQGYRVEAWPERKDPSPSVDSLGGPGTDVDVFNLMLYGVPGRQPWFCERVPRLSVSAPYEFRIKSRFGVEWDKPLRSRTPFPGPDPELIERLEAAGLIDILSRFERGSAVALPRASFSPSMGAAAEEWLRGAGGGGLSSLLKEALRASGREGLESAVDERLRAAEAENPSQLWCEVEMGTARVPSEGRFRELLDLAARIARINADVNQ